MSPIEIDTWSPPIDAPAVRARPTTVAALALGAVRCP